MVRQNRRALAGPWIIWGVCALAINGFLNSLFDPDTAQGEVALTLVAAAIIWIANRIYRVWKRRRTLYGFYSRVSFDAAPDAGFTRETGKTRTIWLGSTKLVVGFAPRQSIQIAMFDVRPVERRWGRWTNVQQPYPVRVDVMRVHQRDWHDQGGASKYIQSKVYPDLSGKKCYIPNEVPALNNDHVIWLELTVIAKEEWSGALSVRVRVADDDPLFLRLPLTVSAGSQ